MSNNFPDQRATMQIQASNMNNQNVKRLLMLFCLQIIAWGIIPAIVRYALSSDQIESYIWGNALQFGYDKNPYLTGWLGGLYTLLGGSSNLFYYLVPQLFVCTGIFSIYKIAQRFCDDNTAFIASTCLLFCTCYSLGVLLYNDNYILLALWPLSIWFFLRILENNSLTNWLFFAIFIGAASVAKYSTIFLILSIGFYIIASPKHRRLLVSPGFMIASFIFLLITIPNLLWLHHHNNISLTWATRSRHTATNVLAANLPFLVNLGIYLSSSIVVMLAGIIPLKNSQDRATPFRNTFFKLFSISLLPLIIAFIVSTALQAQLHREWAIPFLYGLPLLLLYLLKVRISPKNCARYSKIITILLIAYSASYYVIASNYKATATQNFPSKKLAIAATQYWHSLYPNKPLRYIIGDRYLAGYISRNLPNHPQVLMDYSFDYSPTLNYHSIIKDGALIVGTYQNINGVIGFIGEKSMQKAMRKNLHTDFTNSKRLEIPWHRSKQKLGIILGTLPPTH